MNWHVFPASDFAAHRAAWDGLNRLGPRSPLLESRFVEPLLKHFGTGRERLMVFGETADKPTAMGVFTRVKFGVWSTFQPAQEPVGLWINTGGIPIAQMLAKLAPCLPPATLVIGVTQQDPYLFDRPEDGEHLSTLDYIKTAYVAVDHDFESYWASRGKNLRHNLKRQRNRLEREGIHTRLEVFDQPAQMLQAVSQYGEMESAGWKNQNGSAVHIDNVQGRFYVDALSALAATGQARVYRYYYNDSLVASDLCVLGEGMLVILKTTYDETIEGSSPTMLMRQELFQEVFAGQDIRRIEFYGKVMDWHTKWSESMRVMYHVNYYPWKVFRLLKDAFR